MSDRLIVVVAFLAVSCQAAVPKCVPGATVECPCLGGKRSAQICKPDGTYGACACEQAAVAPTPAEKPATCDATGRWDFKGTMAQGGACFRRKTFSDALTIGRDKKGAYSIRASTREGENKLVVRDQSGECILELIETINEVPSGTPDYVDYTITLKEAGGQVSGEGIYRDIDDDRFEQNVARCSEKFTVKGTKRPLAKGDLELNRAAIRKDFETFMKFIDRCELPTLKKGAQGVKVELTIASRGGVDTMVVNGTDQDVAQNCDAFLSENRLGLFSNPSGKRQKIAFSYP